MRALLGVSLLLACAGVPAVAQQQREPARIEDNSFLLEEAYNQEAGIVQHISNLTAFGPGSRGFLYAVTQEWPVGGPLHQLSYTVPVLFGDGRSAGIGDVLLNYRVGLRQHGRTWIAPRLSLALPTGSWRSGFGTGSAGVQVLVPVSVRATSQLVVHANAGMAFVPAARTRAGTRRALAAYVVGGSLVGPVLLPANAMLEVLAVSSDAVTSSGAVERSTDVVVSPGFRFAVQVGGVQIVPGAAVPFHLRGSRQHDLLFYLSIEHAFRAVRDAARDGAACPSRPKQRPVSACGRTPGPGGCSPGGGPGTR